MNSTYCSTSSCLEVDVLPVTGRIQDIESNSLKFGLDVYDSESSSLTDDNILDSVKRGGNEMYFKLGSYWYNLLDDRCVNNSWFVPSNAVAQEDLDKLLWGRWYQKGDASPVYLK